MSGRAADRELLLAAVEEAGRLALKFFHGDLRHWQKAPGDPVSEADHAVNDLLAARLRAARPDYGWLSEESADAPERLRRHRLWLVDPIDGTRAFIERRPEFTISVALVEAGRPALGVVFNPATAELFEAIAGGGTRLNGAAIRAGRRESLEGARLISGRRIFERAGWPAPPKDASFHSISSIAYRIALVAAGRYDAVVSLGEKSEWDVAAADLILAEAGGHLTTARGEPFRYNRPKPRLPSVVAAGAPLHGVLMRFLDGVPRAAGARW